MRSEVELLRLRDQVIGLKAELAEVESIRQMNRSLQKELADSRIEISNMTIELSAMRNSWSWRLGHALMAPIRKLRSAGNFLRT